jgi:asparagine synthase (glutamine-hydrolysing)
MCGIAGFIHKDSCDVKCHEIEKLVHESQACRGPESSNSWTKQYGSTTVHLYHQRLRIQDLSSSADQPMHSGLKPSHHIVFNGEIYNKDSLHRILIPNHVLTTHSDTEVLLEALKATSTQEVLDNARGMFAFGIVNSDLKEIEIVRDRFGEKPLHYSFSKKHIFFSSQFDTIAHVQKIIGFKLTVNQEAIYEYLALGYFPTNSSLFQGIFKLPASSIGKWNYEGDEFLPPIVQRWDKRWKANIGINTDLYKLDDVLTSAISEQLIGDVPIGVFLSGGCDSTLVSAIAQKVNTNPIHSFSLGFTKKDFDESKYALQASHELGTVHHAFKMDENDAIEILPSVLKAFPEPLGDPSVFPTMFISREARKVVTVVLTGDGADELFFGYGRYSRYQQLERLDSTESKNQSLRNKILFAFLRRLTGFTSIKHSKIRRLRSHLISSDYLDKYLSLVGFAHINSVVDHEAFSITLSKIKSRWNEFGVSQSSTNRLREIDVSSYLVDDILVKVDRAAMAFSLETRAPFLDARVSELAKNASDEWLRSTEQKHVVKAILEKYVSPDIFRRPKMGFGAPIGDWFRTSLHDWAEEIVFDFDWDSVGVRRDFVVDLWNENESSKDSSATYLWMLVALASSVQTLK